MIRAIGRAMVGVMSAATCPRCDHAVALHEGRPHVRARGSVELWHRSCWDARDIPARPVAVHVAPREVSPRLVRGIAGAVVGSALIGVLIAQWTWLDVAPPPPASLVSLSYEPVEPVAMRARSSAREAVPTRLAHVDSAIEARWPVPEIEGVPLDETYPTLRTWTHPVVGSSELMPEQTSRHFGVPRLGVDVPRPECGEGHCGVDLDGPRGRALVAVAGGVIVRVERHEMGLDGKSGRYVRIAHDDGTLTAYMHMDDVDEDLQVGNHVLAGQYLGTLGATATYGAPPHLHFSLELPNHGGSATDSTDTHYVDPAPFLVRSEIVAAPIRQHAIKPAF